VPVLIRPFRRADRDQVTALVNGHAAAVVPGVAASVNTVLAQFEREPDEVIVDPWVLERRALVAEQDGGIAAAALVVRYRDEADEETELIGFFEKQGFLELTRTRRGWERTP
jgi:hypothetical protein